MTEKRIYEAFPGGHAVYPEFTPAEGEDSAAAERMNTFYRTLRDAAVQYGKALSENQEGGARRFSAEYTRTDEPQDRIRIEYTLRVRRRGRTEAVKTLVHRWQQGYLCLPEKKKSAENTPKHRRMFKGFTFHT